MDGENGKNEKAGSLTFASSDANGVQESQHDFSHDSGDDDPKKNSGSNGLGEQYGSAV